MKVGEYGCLEYKKNGGIYEDKGGITEMQASDAVWPVI